MRSVSTVLAAALLATAIAVPAAAQDAKPLDINIGFGFTPPYSDRPTFGTATVFPFGVTYNLNETLGVQGSYGFHRFGSKDLPANADDPPADPDYISNVPLSAKHQIHDLDVALVFSAPDKRGTIRPYGLAGIGLYQQVVSVTTPATGDATVCAPVVWLCYPTAVPASNVIGERRSNDFGFNVGGGATLRFGDLVRLFIELRYVHTFGPTVTTPSGATVKANGNYFPIVFGIKI